MIEVFDEQTGKLVSGFPCNINEFTFELVDMELETIGIFDISLLPKK